MKPFYLFLAMAVSAVASCGNKKATDVSGTVSDSLTVTDSVTVEAAPTALVTTKSEYKKQDKYCEVSLEVEWPEGNDIVTATIRKDLLKRIDSYLALEGNTRCIAAYKKSDAALQEAVTYYGTQTFKLLSESSAENHEIRIETAREIAEEQGEEPEIPEIARFSIDLDVDKEYDTERYCVFSIEKYQYSGGAHGMTSCNAGTTYNKADGKVFDKFLKPSAVKAMQPLIRKGLVEYFSEQDPNVTNATLNDMLQIEGNTIPLPIDTPYPSEEGLLFCYAHYEIACYAAGRPTFCIPYNKVKPYLTAEAVALLGL